MVVRGPEDAGALQMRVSDPLTPPPVLPAAPEAAPGCTGDMADTPRDAGLKQAPAPRNEKAPADFGYVGIDSILEQMRRKAMKQGFEFNIMVVGECVPRPAGAGAPSALLQTGGGGRGRGRTHPARRVDGAWPRVCLPGGPRFPSCLRRASAPQHRNRGQPGRCSAWPLADQHPPPSAVGFCGSFTPPWLSPGLPRPAGLAGGILVAPGEVIDEPGLVRARGQTWGSTGQPLVPEALWAPFGPHRSPVKRVPHFVGSSEAQRGHAKDSAHRAESRSRALEGGSWAGRASVGGLQTQGGIRASPPLSGVVLVLSSLGLLPVLVCSSIKWDCWEGKSDTVRLPRGRSHWRSGGSRRSSSGGGEDDSP